VNIYGQTLDVEAYMNRESLAVQLPLLSNEYLGITYDTFRNDIQIFGSLVGLSAQEMDFLADIVDQINAVINIEETSEETFEFYSEVFIDFFKNLDVTSKETRIGSENELIRCTEIKVKISKSAIISLLLDIYDLLENDEVMLERLEVLANQLPGYIGNDVNGNEQILKEFRSFIRDFKKKYSGDIEVLFFVDSDDRLLRVEMIADVKYDGEASELRVELDFGSSIYDTWIMSLSYIDSNSDETVSITWDFEERSSKHVNMILIERSDNTADTIKLISEWDMIRGDFLLAYAEGMEVNELTGIFTTDDKNFNIKLDDLYPEDSSNSLMVEISTETGVQIEEIIYINIDKWGSSLMEAIMRLILNGIF